MHILKEMEEVCGVTVSSITIPFGADLFKGGVLCNEFHSITIIFSESCT